MRPQYHHLNSDDKIGYCTNYCIQIFICKKQKNKKKHMLTDEPTRRIKPAIVTHNVI